MDDDAFERFAEEAAAEVADRFENLVTAVNLLIVGAGTGDDPGPPLPPDKILELMRAHPALLSDGADRMLADYVENARQNGFPVRARRVEQHRAAVANYRRLSGAGRAS